MNTGRKQTQPSMSFTSNTARTVSMLLEWDPMAQLSEELNLHISSRRKRAAQRQLLEMRPPPPTLADPGYKDKNAESL